MAKIYWTIHLPDDERQPYYYEEDCVVEFTSELEDGELVITVDSYKNCHGANFGVSPFNSLKTMMFLEVKEYLENDDAFLDAAWDEVQHEFVVTGRGANDPDAAISRRAS